MTQQRKPPRLVDRSSHQQRATGSLGYGDRNVRRQQGAKALPIYQLLQATSVDRITNNFANCLRLLLSQALDDLDSRARNTQRYNDQIFFVIHDLHLRVTSRGYYKTLNLTSEMG